MFTAAAANLEARVDFVNALNVFPVPDGDTGTNMLLTMRAALEEAARGPAALARAGETAAALAKGSLMGARGNSGVILSQILRGFSKSVQAKALLKGADIATALQEASAQAYRVVTHPVEGTILTVVREAAAAANRQPWEEEAAPGAVLQAATVAARAAVARTPFQLEILRENGVVDAGGEGLALLLEGALRYLQGGAAPAGAPAQAAPATAPAPFVHAARHDATVSYGFCTEVLLERCVIGPDALGAKVLAMGSSVLVAGDEGLLMVHLHTPDPQGALAYFRSVGAVVKTKVENIDAQHQEFVARRPARPQGEAAVVAVVSGEGMAELYRSLGASAIVPGGQTMNPSARDLLEAAHGLPHQTVIVLPNNANVVTTAAQARELAQGWRMLVVPTEDLAQGIAALLAFNPEAGAEANREAMDRARRAVRTGEITRAVKAARIDGRAVRKGQVIGLAAGHLVVTEDDLAAAVVSLAERLGAGAGSTITLYLGAGLEPSEAEGVVRAVRARFPSAQVEPFQGGQPHYPVLVAVE